MNYFYWNYKLYVEERKKKKEEKKKKNKDKEMKILQEI